MEKWKCIGKEYYDTIAGVPIYFCRKIIYRGMDVTKYIKGMYRSEKNEIWITEYADGDTIAHEVAHAILKKQHPELYELAKKDVEAKIVIEKMVRNIQEEVKEEYLL
ncbi:MAG: hypothetical protein B6U75_03460 [Desulfurococcales archaeon ex4484_217_1]|nr:MAG: hypothetical protein B6U75_03460 [Desulfurococcales archaeon ex4484_217_1]